MKYRSIIVLLVLTIAFTACTKAQPLKVAVLLNSDLPDVDYYRLIARGVSKQLELIADPDSQIQIDYLVTKENDSALNPQLVELQRQKLHTILQDQKRQTTPAEGVQAILFTPECAEPLADLLTQARDQGVKTVSLAGPIPGVDASVGRSFDAQTLDPFLTQQLEGGLVMAGGPKIPFYDDLSLAVTDHLNKTQPKLKLVAKNYDFGPALWRSRAYTFNFLVISSDLALMVALDDHIGRANISAATERDRGQAVHLISFGGSQALLDEARDYPNFVAVAKLDPQRIGAYGALLAYNLVYKPEKISNTNVDIPAPLQTLDQASSWDYPFPEKGYTLP